MYICIAGDYVKLRVPITTGVFAITIYRKKGYTFVNMDGNVMYLCGKFTVLMTNNVFLLR